MIHSEQEAKELLAKLLSFSKADSAVALLSGEESEGVRFAVNSVTTAGYHSGQTVVVESHFGKRAGSVNINITDEQALRDAVRKSEEIARLAPENPEFVEPLGPQQYITGPGYCEATARASSADLVALCEPALRRAESDKNLAAGYTECGRDFTAVATSKGLFGYGKSTSVDFSTTIRERTGSGSGWAGRTDHDITRVNADALALAASKKCASSKAPAFLAAGDYTVILEPSATSDLMWRLIERFDARSADEGRSFLTRKGGGNRRGEKLFNESVSLFSDPANDVAPGATFTGDGLPLNRQDWIKDGVAQSLIYSRFWAQKMKAEVVGQPSNLIMPGGTATMEEMIKQTRRGVLVTRFWDVRDVDPRTVLLTGLTRDGNFLIEDGEIRRPVNNFRFNESPISVFNNIVAMGPSVRARGGEGPSSTSAPALLVGKFHFASVSKAA